MDSGGHNPGTHEDNLGTLEDVPNGDMHLRGTQTCGDAQFRDRVTPGDTHPRDNMDTHSHIWW